MGHRPPRASRVHTDDRGVTAVELLVVIGLVVVLAAVAVVSVNGIRDRQRTSACKAELTKVQTAVEAFRSLPASRNPGASPPASLAVLKFSGLLDAKTGDYVTYTRSAPIGHWVPHYAERPEGNCV